MDDATLCREVAVKVMGWGVDPRNPDGFVVPNEGNPSWGHYEKFPPSWASAGRVIEKMREMGWNYAVSNTYAAQYPHSASFWMGSTMLPREWVDAENFPRAVFKAALAAVDAAKETSDG